LFEKRLEGASRLVKGTFLRELVHIGARLGSEIEQTAQPRKGQTTY
jgi:hypothetical protein